MPAQLSAVVAAAGVTSVTVVAGVAAVGYADAEPAVPGHPAASDAADRVVVAPDRAREHGSPSPRPSPRQPARPGYVLHPRSGSAEHEHARQSPRRASHRSGKGSGHREARRPRPHVVHGPLAANDALQTVAHAEQSTWNDPGQCLQWARERAGIPSGAATAAGAWVDADMKRRGDTTPPPGAAVYWTGGSHGYGHVAISVGHGRVRSSDAGGIGRVATVAVGWITKNWDMRYAGWSNSINGYTIPGVPG